MSLPQLQDVLFSERERFDLSDANALARNKKLQAYVALLLGAAGTVFQGFTGSITGLTFSLDAVDGVAVDNGGNMLTHDSAVSTSVVLPANSVIWIHAYENETDTDSDSRRFIDDSSDPAVEYVDTVATRRTYQGGLYVKSVGYSSPPGYTAPTLAGFDASHNFGGSIGTKYLVPIAMLVTDGSGVVGGTYQDARKMWIVNGNAPTNPNTTELPHSFATGKEHGVIDVRSFFKAVVSVLGTSNLLTSTSWWNSLEVLRRSVTMTASVGGGEGAADFTDFPSFTAAITASMPRDVFLKKGAYGAINLSGVNGFRFVGSNFSNLADARVTVSGMSHSGAANSFEGIYFSGHLVLDGGPTVFKNCHFVGADITGGNATFENCYFLSASTTGLCQTAALSNVEFVGCTFANYDNTSRALFGTSGGVPSWTGVRFTRCAFTGPGYVATLTSSSTAGVSSVDLVFNECTFANDRVINATQGATALGSAIPFTLRFNNCKFTQNALDVPLFAITVSCTGSLLEFTDCYVNPYSNAVVSFNNMNAAVKFVCLQLHAKGTTFLHQTTATAPLFEIRDTFVGMDTYGQYVFSGCTFFYRRASMGGGVFRLDVDTFDTIAATAARVSDVRFLDCEFLAQNSKRTDAFGSPTSGAVIVTNTGSHTHQATLVMRGCFFGGSSDTTGVLPVKLQWSAGKASALVSGSWRNGSDGSATDTFLDSSGAGTVRANSYVDRALAIT